VPLGQWATFLEVMTDQGNQTEQLIFKKAALHLLGLFMEQVYNLTQVPEADINRIWNCILNNINPENVEITRIVAKALTRLAPASVVNFRMEEQKQKIMDGVFNLLKI